MLGGAFGRWGDCTDDEGDDCVGDRTVGDKAKLNPGADVGGADAPGGPGGAGRLADILFMVPFVVGIGGGPDFAVALVRGGAGLDGGAVLVEPSD